MKRLENIGGESIIKSYKRHKMERENPPKENKTLEEKIKLIDGNFYLADKEFNGYSSIKSKLKNDGLFKGEVSRYQKELINMKKEMFDTFNTTWSNLTKYQNDIPFDSFKRYKNRFDSYDYDIKRNKFKGSIFDK